MSDQLETETEHGISVTTVSPYYAADFICTYKMIEDDYEDSLMLYRLQLLQAFNLINFNDDIINKVSEDLYEKYKNNEYILKLIESSNLTENLTEHFNDRLDNNLTIFRSYFKYETFHLFHSILCSLENDKKINEVNYEKLLELNISE